MFRLDSVVGTLTWSEGFCFWYRAAFGRVLGRIVTRRPLGFVYAGVSCFLFVFVGFFDRFGFFNR
jgi:hypothetical protein